MSDDGTAETVKAKVSQVNFGPNRKPWHELTEEEKASGEWKQYIWCDEIVMAKKLSKSDIKRNFYMKKVQEKEDRR